MAQGHSTIGNRLESPEMEFDMPVNVLADKYPMMTDDEYEELRASIESNGLLDPITLDPEGTLLDGRNRLKACIDLGLKPEFVTATENSVTLITIRNANRRNLSAGQRSMAVAMGMRENGLWNAESGRWKQGASKQVLANTKTSDGDVLARCGKILAHNMAWADAVLAGESMLRERYDQGKIDQEFEVSEAKKLKKLEDNAPDLKKRVDDRSLDLDEAATIYRGRMEKEATDKRLLLEGQQRRATAVVVAHNTFEGVRTKKWRTKFIGEYDPNLVSKNDSSRFTGESVKTIGEAMVLFGEEMMEEGL